MDRPLAITLRSVAHRTQTQAPKKERPGHTSVYALHSALTQCAQGVEGDVTLRLEVWQLRQDCVVRLRRLPENVYVTDWRSLNSTSDLRL